MTVRMPQSKSASTTQSTDPYGALRRGLAESPSVPPAPVSAVPGAPPGGDVVATAVSPLPPDHQTRGDGQRAQRAARQQRRHLSVACAVLIAVCLVITILVVGMARNHSPGAQVVVPALALAISGHVDARPSVPTIQPNQFHGATAPEGGHN